MGVERRDSVSELANERITRQSERAPSHAFDYNVVYHLLKVRSHSLQLSIFSIYWLTHSRLSRISSSEVLEKVWPERKREAIDAVHSYIVGVKTIFFESLVQNCSDLELPTHSSAFYLAFTASLSLSSLDRGKLQRLHWSCQHPRETMEPMREHCASSSCSA